MITQETRAQYLLLWEAFTEGYQEANATHQGDLDRLLHQDPCLCFLTRDCSVSAWIGKWRPGVWAVFPAAVNAGVAGTERVGKPIAMKQVTGLHWPLLPGLSNENIDSSTNQKRLLSCVAVLWAKQLSSRGVLLCVLEKTIPAGLIDSLCSLPTDKWIKKMCCIYMQVFLSHSHKIEQSYVIWKKKYMELDIIVWNQNKPKPKGQVLCVFLSYVTSRSKHTCMCVWYGDWI